MSTKEIMEKVKALQDEIEGLKTRFPFSATIYDSLEEELPSDIELVSNIWDSDYTSYTIASDDLEVIKEYCLSTGQEFVIRTEGRESHNSVWDNEKRKYVIGINESLFM